MNEFKDLTLKLMAAKYAYYIQSRPIMSDYNYDVLEHTWYKMGLKLGVLQEGETSPCIDFDYNHPLAKQAIEMVDKGGVR